MTFALIGHQDSWAKILHVVNAMRSGQGNPELSLDEVRGSYTYFPPRKLFDITVSSTRCGALNGCYIESFLSPDELDAAHLHKNFNKVKEACACASRLGADVVSLGGFTSIILETRQDPGIFPGHTAFTTGNTLTAAFIADAVEKAAIHWEQPLHRSGLLIIGSTGDIGSACVAYFKGKVKKLLLCARQPGPLRKQQETLLAEGIAASSSVTINDLLPGSDYVICVASSMISGADLSLLPGHAIICDAGYPKNLQHAIGINSDRMFYGGMGLVTGGFRFTPDYRHDIYDFNLENAGHGCLLEAVVLAMENRAVPFSTGRGRITPTAMQEIRDMASRHGIVTAPLFNDKGPIGH
jgi:fatty aldehyde-generating acyl-ACP reductase